MKNCNIMIEPVFTVDWTTMHFPSWEKLVPNPKDVKNFLEIGNFEGRSTLWWASYLENAELVSIDQSFNLEQRQRLLYNVSLHPRANMIDLRFGRSEFELSRIGPESVDVIYVDGSHEAQTVLMDALSCYKILKPGGVMIFDDYEMSDTLYDPHCVSMKTALDAFLEVTKAKIIYKGYQLSVTK